MPVKIAIGSLSVPWVSHTYNRKSFLIKIILILNGTNWDLLYCFGVSIGHISLHKRANKPIHAICMNTCWCGFIQYDKYEILSLCSTYLDSWKYNCNTLLVCRIIWRFQTICTCTICYCTRFSNTYNLLSHIPFINRLLAWHACQYHICLA